MRAPLLIGAVAFFLSSCSFHASNGQSSAQPGKMQSKKIIVKCNRNIELYGLIVAFDMGSDLVASNDTTMIDGRRATWKQWYAAIYRNYLQYKQFDTCEVMTIYRKRQGYFYDFYIDFLLQVDDAPFARITSKTDKEAYIGFSPRGDSAEARQKATAFLNAFNAFYKVVDFDAYWAKNKQYYDMAEASVKKNLPGDYLLPVMERYYRQQFNNYCLVPSLSIPTSMGFGKINRATRTVYNTFGPFSFQSFDSTHLDMGFDYPERIKILTVHEFGHPFANPAVDKLPKALMDSTKYLFEPIKKEMTERSYDNWTSCLYEHFVKAGEAIVAEKIGDTARVKIFIQDAVKAGFIYVPFIVDQLKQWDKNEAATVPFDQAVLNTMRKLEAQCRK